MKCINLTRLRNWRTATIFRRVLSRVASEKRRLLAARRSNPTFVPTNSPGAPPPPFPIAMSEISWRFVDPDPAGCRAAVNFLSEEDPEDEEDDDDNDDDEDEEDDEESAEDEGEPDGYSE
jgi:hypothetical protein